jgi:hypothetical protein
MWERRSKKRVWEKLRAIPAELLAQLQPLFSFPASSRAAG